jgi:hypothetical protein
MQDKLSIVAIAAVITAVFTTTIVMGLTVQSAAATQVCSPKNPSVCADGTAGNLAQQSLTPNTKAGTIACCVSGGPNAESGINTQHHDFARTSINGECGGKPFVRINNGPITCSG